MALCDKSLALASNRMARKVYFRIPLGSSPKGGLVIACGEGAVRILALQAPGGKKMKAEDYLRGHGIPAGTRL